MVRSSSQVTAVRRSLRVLAAAAVASAAALAPSGGAAAAAEGPLLSYLVVTAPGSGDVSHAQDAVVAAGGTVWVSYGEIGVIVARSTAPDFAARLRASGAVQLVGASRTAAITASADDPSLVQPAAPGPAAAAEGADPLEAQQWDMRMIHADEAHSVALGSRDVVVGVLDSGVDAHHPDLAGQVDQSLSASCVDGGRVDTAPE